MEATRNLCAQVPVSLHDRVRQEREALGQSLSEYVTQILKEHFEGGKTTMAATKTLSMQLNSITIMDLVAYGGAAAGIVMAVTQFRCGHVGLEGCLVILLLAADFFIPMRQLGSFFHIAMNRMAASDKIFRLLDLPEPEQKTRSVPEDCSVHCENLCFSYESGREVLKDVTLDFPKGGFTAIVGESGCGKSTIAASLMGRNRGYTGTLTVGGVALSEISEESLLRNFTYVSHQSYLFQGTVGENLKKTKIRIMVTLTLLMSVGFLLMHQVLIGRIVLGGVWVFHIVYFLFGVKTIPAGTFPQPQGDG